MISIEKYGIFSALVILLLCSCGLNEYRPNLAQPAYQINDYVDCDEHAYGVSADGNFLFSYERLEKTPELLVRTASEPSNIVRRIPLNLHSTFAFDAPRSIAGSTIGTVNLGTVTLTSLSDGEQSEYRTVFPETRFVWSGHEFYQNGWFTFPAGFPTNSVISFNAKTGESKTLQAEGSGLLTWFLSESGEILSLVRKQGLHETEVLEFLKENASVKVDMPNGGFVNKYVPSYDKSRTLTGVWAVSQIPEKQSEHDPRYTILHWDMHGRPTQHLEGLGIVRYVHFSPNNAGIEWVDTTDIDGHSSILSLGEESNLSANGVALFNQVLAKSSDGKTRIDRLVSADGNVSINLVTAAEDTIEIRHKLCFSNLNDHPAAKIFPLLQGDEHPTKLILFETNSPRRGYVINLHGGPWSKTSLQRSPRISHLNDAGYTVISVEYRGSTGYGADYVQASFGNFSGMKTDVLKARAWVAQNSTKGDSKFEPEVYLMGSSFGGYLAISTLQENPSMFDGLILTSALFDRDNRARRSRPGTVALKSIDPIDLILEDKKADITIPLLPNDVRYLVIHGQRDQLIGIEQAQEFIALLHLNGARVQFLEVDSGHSLQCKGCVEKISNEIKRFLIEQD